MLPLLLTPLQLGPFWPALQVCSFDLTWKERSLQSCAPDLQTTSLPWTLKFKTLCF